MDEVSKAKDGWEKLLNPQRLRTNLLLASLYLAAYELLFNTVVDRIRCFFIPGFVDGVDDSIFQEKYLEVKQLNKNLLLASCQWLEQNGAISMNDITVVKGIRHHRNEIAHELPNLLSDADREISFEYLQQIRRLLRKVETWWIRNVDMMTNSDFDGVEVADEDIHPGPVLVLDEIIRIALNSENGKRK